MHYNFTREVATELAEVDACFKNALLFWWDDIKPYISPLDDDITWNYLPAIAISAYQNLDLDRNLCISMTNMLKTFYFAQSIHGVVKDDEEGQIYNQDFQFTILIGDYIFGRALKLLLEAEGEEFVEHYSQMMCEINEGMMLKYKYRGNAIKALEKTTGSLYAIAFYTAGRLAKIDEEACNLYRDVGFHLGMALELYETGEMNISKGYLHKCEQQLTNFSLLYKGSLQGLIRVIKEIKDVISPVEKAVV